MRSPQALQPLDERRRTLNVIVETPKGSRNKYRHDPKSGLYELKTVLAEGMYFPFDFGFLPSTLGEDGDPLDVLVLMEEPAHPGALVPARLLGVMEAVQAKQGKKPKRNDRLIAVADASRVHDGVRKINHLSGELVREIEQFFISYNSARGKRFEVKRCKGRKRALRLIREAEKRARKAARQ